MKDFTPVTLAASYPLLLVAHPGAGFRSESCARKSGAHARRGTSGFVKRL